MPLKDDGIMVILSSPSGAGKTSLVKLLSEKDNFNISISHTTRRPRDKEIPNKDYYFVEETEFNRLIQNIIIYFFHSITIDKLKQFCI